jgi:hypothetical protein
MLAAVTRSVRAESAVQQIGLNDGQKWATDASLRARMAVIRTAFDTNHPTIHAGQETDAQ